MSAINTPTNTSILTQIEGAIGNLEENIKKYYNTLTNYAKNTGQTKESAIQMAQNDQVKLYANKNFEQLSKTDLKKPITEDGDTIVHIMAFNNDKEAFEKIKNANPKAFSYDVINNPNKKGQLPVHLALEGSKTKTKDTSFVDYMVTELNANPNIPDKQDRIIVREQTEEKKLEVQNKENLNRLNQMIMMNIENLTNLSGQKSGHTCAPSGPAASIPQNKNLDFITKLTNHYATKGQTGGYMGKRVIRNYYSDRDITETGENDSFVTSNKNQILSRRTNDINDLSSDELYTEYSESGDVRSNTSNKRGESNRRSNDRSNILSDTDDITTPNLDYSDYRSSRSARAGVNNPDASRASKDSMQRVRRFMDDWKTDDFELSTVNNNGNLNNNDNETDTSEIDTEYIRSNLGNRRRNANERTNITNVSNERVSDFDDDDDDDANANDEQLFDLPDDDDDLITSQDRTHKNDDDDDNDNNNDNDDDNDDDNDMNSQNRTRNNGNNDDDNNNNDDNNDDNDNDMDSHNRTRRNRDNDFDDDSLDIGTSSANERRRPRHRERDTKVDETYKSFLQKIMDKLGVDEQTARTYRSAIKILIERDNPELRGRENDALKVKRIEEIIDNEEQFNDIIKRVDEQIDEIKRYMEERRQAGEQRRKEWEERRKTRGTRSESATETTGEPSSTSATSAEATEEKPKRRRRGTKVGEDGYLESDEIIFSPTYQ